MYRKNEFYTGVSQSLYYTTFMVRDHLQFSPLSHPLLLLASYYLNVKSFSIKLAFLQFYYWFFENHMLCISVSQRIEPSRIRLKRFLFRTNGTTSEQTWAGASCPTSTRSLVSRSCIFCDCCVNNQIQYFYRILKPDWLYYWVKAGFLQRISDKQVKP